jgi:large subunit ribosomal protein L14e
MMDIGRVCVKIAGRDAGKLAIILEKPSGVMVLVDGNVRRRKCNIKHLDPTKDVLKIKAKASTEEVLGAMMEAKLPIEKTPKRKKEAPKEEKPAKKVKKAAKK